MKECICCHVTISDEDVIKYNNVCPGCHTENAYVDGYIMDIKRISDDEAFVEAMINLHNNDPIEFQFKMTQLQAQQKQLKEEQKRRAENTVACPCCGCTNVQVTTRGYSLFMGFIGSGSPRNVCAKCGYKWRP